MTGFGARLADGGRPRTGPCASGSTRIRACSPSGGSPTTPAGWSGSPPPASTRSPGTSPWSSRSRRSSNGTARAGIAVLEQAAGRARRRDVPDAGRSLRRQARRHRLHDGRLRRRLPGGRCAAGRGRRHALALPGVRLARVGDPDAAADAGRGVFVLARTSNPEGAEVQLADAGGPHRRAGDRRRGGGRQPRRSRRRRRAGTGQSGSIAIGDGCGPGIPAGAGRRRRRGDRRPRPGPRRRCTAAVLAPGLGAQGAGPADLAARFAAVRGVCCPRRPGRCCGGAGPVGAPRGRGRRCATSSPPPRPRPTEDPVGRVSGVTYPVRRGGTTTMVGAPDPDAPWVT